MDIAVYTEDKLTPSVLDVLRAVVGEFPDVTGIELWNQYTTNRTAPVLVLGNMPVVTPMRYIKAISQKQIMASSAAITELTASIALLLMTPKHPEFHYRVIGLGENAQPFFNRMDDILVVDIETGGDIEIMTPQETWLLSVSVNDGKNIIVLTEEWLDDDKNKRMLGRWLGGKGKKLIAHNMKFDFRTLGDQLGVPIFGHHCTMLMHHALNPGGKEHGLKPLCAKYLGASDWDKEAKQYVKGKYKLDANGYDDKVSIHTQYFYPKGLQEKYGNSPKIGFEAIPREILYKYNALDVYWTWLLFEYLSQGALGDERIERIAKFEFEMSNLFQKVESNGMAVDLDYLDELDKLFTQQKIDNDAVLQGTVCELRGKDAAILNPNSPKQVKEFYAEAGYPLTSTAQGVLEELEFPEGDSTTKAFTEALLAARRITKMHGTYVTGITKRTHSGIVYPSFLVHGTSTGRLSSRDPNAQNIPRDEEGKLSLRRIFVPRDVQTRSLLSVDYAQAELRVMACLSKDEYLISLFQPGMPDFFTSLLPSTFPRIDIPSIDKNTKKNLRASLKGVIYGMSYGRRAAAIAKALDMDVREAQAIITNYFKAAPALYDWRMWVQETAVSPEHTLISPFGRYYQAEVVTGKNRQNVINSGLAFLPQSTASDMCVSAAIEVQKWVGEYGAMIIATIHDAILIDCPDDHLEAVACRVQSEMELAGRKVFGGMVEFATEATWGKSWQGI